MADLQFALNCAFELGMEKEFKILGIVPGSIRTGWSKALTTRVTHHSSAEELLGDNQCHLFGDASVPRCGDNSRPSRDEIVVLVHTMLTTMICEKPSVVDDRPSRYDSVFPVGLPLCGYIFLLNTDTKRKTILVVFDCAGHSRIISGYYDGTLHVQFTRILDFSEYGILPPVGTSYLDSIDKEKFYQMMNLLLKWAWPIALGITNKSADIPVIVNSSTDGYKDPGAADEGANEWVLV